MTSLDGIRKLCDFPVAPAMFPAPLLTLPNASSLADWIELDSTLGNNVVTRFGNGNGQTLVRAVNRVFSATLNARDQQLLNAFFFCNYLHDFFLLLGFGEKEGNFQSKNAGTDGIGGDRLLVRLFSSTLPNLGKMDAHVDGEPAELKLGRAPNGTHAALNCDVVIHEYTHGVAQRMVGGRAGAASLTRAQSLALSEGWSDYFAITLRNHHLTTPNFTFAGWAGLSKPARSAPYDDAYAGHYGLIGKKPHATLHGAGEIIAAALIRFNKLLGEKLNDRVRGNCLGWRIVVESFRQCNADKPTLLDGRRAVFDAIRELKVNQISTAEANHAEAAAKSAFARFGMGPAASGPASSELTGMTSDFNE